MMLLPPLALSFYLSRRYLFWIILTMGALLAFVTLIDAVELYRRFSNANSDESSFVVILLLLLGLPQKIDLLMPFIILFGSILCFQNWSKTHELMVVRAFGQNIWQALLPVFITVILLGSFQNLVLNPIKSATLNAQHSIKENLFGTQSSSNLSIAASGVWLKDKGESGDIIIHGPNLDLSQYQINRPVIYQFDARGAISWRIRAETMKLSQNGWAISDAYQSDNLGQTVFLGDVRLNTDITPIDFARTTLAPETISIYALPQFITMLNNTGLPSNEHRVYFQQLLATPLKMLGLVMLAACFTLVGFSRMPRYKLIALGIASGFTIYFISDLIYLLGANARLPIWISGWGPAFTLILGTGYILARSEDR